MDARARGPQLTLGHEEVTNITALLHQAAELLTREDGCCHQIHRTARWSDSQLTGQWLVNLAASLRQRSSNAELDTAPHDCEPAPTNARDPGLHN